MVKNYGNVAVGRWVAVTISQSTENKRWRRCFLCTTRRSRFSLGKKSVERKYGNSEDCKGNTFAGWTGQKQIPPPVRARHQRRSPSGTLFGNLSTAAQRPQPLLQNVYITFIWYPIPLTRNEAGYNSEILGIPHIIVIQN